MICLPRVALRKESVDRNILLVVPFRTLRVVALRKESVDRNEIGITTINSVSRSLSARRAWIEIVNTADKEARKRRRSPQGERG